jgi:cytochrome c oxidase assembly protein subunit 15
MKRVVKWWLLSGLILIFFQIFIGGVTRLTGSGLSITKWDIVTGTIPPLNNEQWLAEFELYKATPQYEKINDGMSLSDFKFIYFWEYLHRLWARSMGFIFLFPFIFFLIKGWLSRKQIRQLLLLVGMTAIVAVFGWIMVASGLIDRPWVSAYKLTWHLSLALIVYGYMAWIVFDSWFPESYHREKIDTKKVLTLFVLIAVQIMLGGIMSGAKAGLAFPTWPDMSGEWVPSLLFERSNWSLQNFIDYDKNLFFPAVIQFFHRSLAYVVLGFGLYMAWTYIKTGSQVVQKTGYALILLLIVQVALGIFTLINCKGQIPVGLGILHQAVAVFLITLAVWMLYISPRNRVDY